MRRIIAAIVIAVCASTAMAQVSVGMLLTVGEWVISSSRKLYYIEVEATGPTFQDAKTEGFKLAVEDAVGSLILTETESNNWNLVRNQVTMYASGYVDHYEVTERKTVSRGTQVRMRVWVAHSGIANRLLNQSQASGAVEGERISAQLETLTRQRNTGDRVLSTVMSDYPHRAFNIGLEQTRVAFDNQRRPQLYVPFVIEWNKKYLSSLEETLKQINHYPKCNTANDACNQAYSKVELRVNYMMWNPGAWFNDNQAWQIMLDNMVASRPVYRLTLHTASGQRIIQCYSAPELDESQYRPEYFANIGPGKVIINGLHTTRIVLNPQIDVDIMSQLTRATVDVTRQSQCKASL